MMDSGCPEMRGEAVVSCVLKMGKQIFIVCIGGAGIAPLCSHHRVVKVGKPTRTRSHQTELESVKEGQCSG